MKQKKIKAWAIFFKHPEGWTFFEAFKEKHSAQDSYYRWKSKLRNWKYKIIPITITYTLPQKKTKTRKQ